MDHRPLNILSLCAGVGGLDLGIRLAQPNARTVCYVEIEAFACEIMATRMEDKALDAAPIWTDLRSFDCKPWRGIVDCIIGGYPCQPFSVAGKQKGADDPRHLWPNIATIIRDIQPRICFFENVAGHLKLGFEQVHDDLSAMGYEVKTGLFTAAEVGSSHKRERLFIMAYRESDRVGGWLSELQHIRRAYECGDAFEPAGSGDAFMADCTGVIGKRTGTKRDRQGQSQRQTGSIGGQLADTDGSGLQETGTEFIAAGIGGNQCELGNTKYNGSLAPAFTGGDGEIDGTKRSTGGTVPSEQSSGTDYVADRDRTGFQKQCGTEPIYAEHEAVECGSCLPFPPGPTGEWDGIPAGLKPSICRMADGLANRVDRIRACGNGVVPLVAAYAWHVLTTFRDGK